MKVALAVALAAPGLLFWASPEFSGAFSGPKEISDGEGAIAGAILLVGAAICLMMPER